MNVPGVMAAVAIGYGVGSIPFGFLLSRAAGLGDIRQVGSGNIGATNVLRTGRTDIAAATLLLDAAKGAAAALLMARLGDPLLPLLAGAAAVLGHCTSPWMRFRGGKGVATGLGVVAAWSWPVGLACCTVWLATAYASRRSSLAALAAFTAAPILMLIVERRGWAAFTLLVSLVVIARHHANIRRLLAGTEPRIGAK